MKPILQEAAAVLLEARRSKRPITDLPAELHLATQEEAYQVQDLMARSYGEIGGWKIGAATPEATPVFAPMPRAWIAASGSTLSEAAHRYRGIEAEIAFLLGKDLPPRATPYTQMEVRAAIASCHPAIEVLESGLLDPTTAARLSSSADMQVHGGFVYGPVCPNWEQIDFTQEQVRLSVNGELRVERTGSNTAGDLLRLLPWLANEAATRTGGLRAGQWITTGSWTSNIQVAAGSGVESIFAHVGRVSLRFA